MSNLLLTASALCTLTVSGQTTPAKGIETYVDCLTQANPVPAKEYVLSLFENYDLVVLCERDHRELTQYDLVLEIAGDERFTQAGGVVFTEIGACNLNPGLNELLHTEHLSDEETDRRIREFHRNATYYPLWENYNWSYLAHGLCRINASLHAADKISWYPCDRPYAMDEPSADEILRINAMERDSTIGNNIAATFASLQRQRPGCKGLVILNYRHAFGPLFQPAQARGMRCAAHYLYDAFPCKVANVMINSTKPVREANGEVSLTAIQDGRWDAAFAAAGIRDAGFDLSGTPFAADGFDYFPFPTGLSYGDVFHGLLFYMPVEEFRIAVGVPGIAGDGFAEAYAARERLNQQAYHWTGAMPPKGSKPVTSSLFHPKTTSTKSAPPSAGGWNERSAIYCQTRDFPKDTWYLSGSSFSEEPNAQNCTCGTAAAPSSAEK